MKKIIRLVRLWFVYHAASAALFVINKAHALVTRFIDSNGKRL